MDTNTVNRVITEITNRLGVGYSVFSDAVSQYAQAKATESLIYSVALFGAAILIIAICFFTVWRNRSIDPDGKVVVEFWLVVILACIVIPGVFFLTSYINWSNAPRGMFLREIIRAVK